MTAAAEHWKVRKVQFEDRAWQISAMQPSPLPCRKLRRSDTQGRSRDSAAGSETGSGNGRVLPQPAGFHEDPEARIRGRKSSEDCLRD